MAVADDHDANQLSKTLWERGLTDWHWTHPTFVFFTHQESLPCPLSPSKKTSSCPTWTPGAPSPILVRRFSKAKSKPSAR
ncbi:hypothetical protein EMIT0P228_40341 [Pseudomonas brassicacearum]